MGAGPGQIIGYSLSGTNNAPFLADVTPAGRLKVDVGGGIIISGVEIDNIVVQQTIPTDTSNNNPKWSFVYDGNGNIESVYQMIGTGSYVNTLSWVGYSGVLPGIGSRVTNISEWSVV